MIELDKIYNCDCLVGIKEIPNNSIDCIITDPPYLLDSTGGGSSALAKRSRRLKDSIEFISNGFDYENLFDEFIRVCKIPNMLIFCSNKQISQTMSFFEGKGLKSTLLIWQKTNPMPTGNNAYISDVEFVVYVHDKGAYFGNDAPLEFKKKVYTSPLVKEGGYHPTQKSVNHIRRYIMVHCPPNGVVLDTFMGSGTTALACIKEKRHFIGFEIDKKYYDIANERINNETRQLTLF